MKAQRPRVLVVDDEPNVLATLQPILSREGFDVHVAEDGASARRALDTNGGFDVVITDLRLGDSDGLAVAQQVHEADTETPVIVLTGFGSLESAVDAMHRGVFDYLLKPCDVTELKSTVRRALDHARLTRGLRDGVSRLDQIAGPDAIAAEKQLRGNITKPTATKFSKLWRRKPAGARSSRTTSMIWTFPFRTSGTSCATSSWRTSRTSCGRH